MGSQSSLNNTFPHWWLVSTGKTNFLTCLKEMIMVHKTLYFIFLNKSVICYTFSFEADANPPTPPLFCPRTAIPWVFYGAKEVGGGENLWKRCQSSLLFLLVYFPQDFGYKIKWFSQQKLIRSVKLHFKTLVLSWAVSELKLC